jgi:hypothetical protein
LEDRSSTPKQIWNRIPDEVRERIVDLALDAPELSPRELATRFTDTESYFVSEASVYRLLKAHDLITSPAGWSGCRVGLAPTGKRRLCTAHAKNRHARRMFAVALQPCAASAASP